MYDEIGFLGSSVDPQQCSIPSFSTTGSFSREVDTAISGLSLNGQLGFDSKFAAHDGVEGDDGDDNDHQLDNFHQHYSTFNPPHLHPPPPPPISFNYSTHKRPLLPPHPPSTLYNLQAQPDGVVYNDYCVGHPSNLYVDVPPLISVDHGDNMMMGGSNPFGGIINNADINLWPCGETVEECGNMNPVFGLWKEIGGGGGGRCNSRGKAKVGNNTERHRRGQMSDKFNALKALIPNPTKSDKASIISDAAVYIKELLRTVEELKTLVLRKRLRGARGGVRKKQRRNMLVCKSSDDIVEMDNNVGLLRSSWLQRKSKDTTVDIRIVEDEVNIKVTTRKKPGCLLIIANVIHKLQLQLAHLTSGNIGDYLVFMINTKIHEGSIVYASGIANELTHAINSHYSP